MGHNLEQAFLRRWQALAGELGLDPETSKRTGDYLLARYSEDGRHYHTVRHIVSMLDGMKNLKLQFMDPVAANLAIFFHDVIYDAARQDNEQRSALRMKEMLGGKVLLHTLERAAFSIEATRKHQETASMDTNLILDLDLAVLGQPWAVYERYARGVMQEYTGVYPDALYREGRVKLFLDPMLEKGKVFLTKEFQDLNTQALRNMEREKEILVSGKTFSGRDLS